MTKLSLLLRLLEHVGPPVLDLLERPVLLLDQRLAALLRILDGLAKEPLDKSGHQRSNWTGQLGRNFVSVPVLPPTLLMWTAATTSGDGQLAPGHD